MTIAESSVKRSMPLSRPVTREFIPIGFHDPFTRENQHLARIRNYAVELV